MIVDYEYDNGVVAIYTCKETFRRAEPELTVSMDTLEEFRPGLHKQAQLAYMIYEGLCDMRSPSAAIVTRQALEAAYRSMKRELQP